MWTNKKHNWITKNYYIITICINVLPFHASLITMFKIHKACHINEALLLNKYSFLIAFVAKQSQVNLRLHNYDLTEGEKTLQVITVCITLGNLLWEQVGKTGWQVIHIFQGLISPTLLYSISTIHLYKSLSKHREIPDSYTVFFLSCNLPKELWLALMFGWYLSPNGILGQSSLFCLVKESSAKCWILLDRAKANLYLA